MHFALASHSGWTKAKTNMTKLVVKRATKTLALWGTSHCRTAPTGHERVFLTLSVSLCLCWSSLLLLWEQQPPHDSAQMGVCGEQLEKEKGREGSGMRIQGKDGRNLNRSLLDRPYAIVKYFHYINSWAASGVFFLYCLQPSHWGFLCLQLWWLQNQHFLFTLFRDRDSPSDWQEYYKFFNHSPQISHHWYLLCLWDILCTFSDKYPEFPQCRHCSLECPQHACYVNKAGLLNLVLSILF